MNFHDISWSFDSFEDLICEFWRGLREKCEALEGSHTNVFIRFKTTKSSRQVIDPIDLIDLAQVAQARVVAVPLIHLSGTWGRNDHWQFERTIVSSSEKLWDVLSKTFKTHYNTFWKKIELKQKFENKFWKNMRNSWIFRIVRWIFLLFLALKAFEVNSPLDLRWRLSRLSISRQVMTSPNIAIVRDSEMRFHKCRGDAVEDS